MITKPSSYENYPILDVKKILYELGLIDQDISWDHLKHMLEEYAIAPRAIYPRIDQIKYATILYEDEACKIVIKAQDGQLLYKYYITHLSMHHLINRIPSAQIYARYLHRQLLWWKLYASYQDAYIKQILEARNSIK